MNRVTTLPSPAAGGLVQTMRRHPVVSFFVLAYAISWVLWIPVLVFHLPTFDPSTHAPSLYILAGIVFGPTGSAFLMTALTQGKAGVLRLLRRFVLWRVSWQKKKRKASHGKELCHFPRRRSLYVGYPTLV